MSPPLTSAISKILSNDKSFQLAFESSTQKPGLNQDHLIKTLTEETKYFVVDKKRFEYDDIDEIFFLH